ncbi:MAG TPA: flavoprotein [Phycisphaerae bacterium]|nr:flavoprotein [Phycisphaerae bacterium]
MSGPRNPDTSASSPRTDELTGCEVVVGVCGGIAAYKTAALVSALVQRGAGVTVAMTAAAKHFVGPLTFEALTARQVFTSPWESTAYFDPQHIRLTEGADVMVIAPATANIIGKIAHGLADDLVSTMVMSAACPVLLAPAMNTRMWENAIVQDNVKSLAARGYRIVPPGEGWLACRTIGSGRMAEPDEILARTIELLKASPPKNAAPNR